MKRDMRNYLFFPLFSTLASFFYSFFIPGMFLSSLFPVVLASTLAQLVAGAPTLGNERGLCDISGFYVHLGEYPNQLPHPQYNPKYVYLGVGTQNYTCNGSSYTYVKVNTKGSLLKHYPGGPELNGNEYVKNGGLDGFDGLGSAPYLGEHFFVGNIPRWDFSVPGGIFDGNENAFVMGAQPAAANIPAPKSTGSDNVAWLYLKKQDGQLADEIYRTDTRGGVAPQSCSGSDSIQVKYVSVYWLTGGSINKY
ncbi:hypothetical protein VKT23_012401 [Stygiomarasmius scandens]|uniref:Malate dehydrogenase n=1 Tax=Marasmiellus scandens TaxID=2682957 RepID=A0ABR1J5Y9_9AGAR